ncbi:MAG: DegT/DnrJ/EryC1/StrS family aminotransferase [Candidatus Wildermuthbacteria bacterium]|nr:DegT/DnrJ/EryC1/StrS family aminotransferase [Candidatus Wildermuthbacteria bacterium]
MIPLLRPTLPKLASLQGKLKDVFRTGMLTNAKYVREFENRCAEYLGVKHAIAVANGTSALMLALTCLDMKGEVILPSFTYSSDGHVLLWCGVKPKFADIDPATLNLDPESIERSITSRTQAIMPTHVFGNPCEIDAIGKIARKHNVKVIYDGAHAFGSVYHGKSVLGFGDVSIVSLTPTKTLTTGEGGLLIVNDEKLARKMKLGRYNGDSENRNEEFLGITARMDELSAILGIEGLKIFPKMQRRRLHLVELYRRELHGLPGITFQKISSGSISAYKDLVILVDKEKFGISRDELIGELRKKNIETKAYFYPIHKKKVYERYQNLRLPNTELVWEKIMNLPLYSHMPEQYAKKVCSVIQSIHQKHI